MIATSLFLALQVAMFPGTAFVTPGLPSHDLAHALETWVDETGRSASADTEVLAAATIRSRDSVKETAEVQYTCPMHPEVRQIEPGKCPKCGMTLKKATAASSNAATPSKPDSVHPDSTEMIAAADAQGPCTSCKMSLDRKASDHASSHHASSDSACCNDSSCCQEKSCCANNADNACCKDGTCCKDDTCCKDKSCCKKDHAESKPADGSAHTH